MKRRAFLAGMLAAIPAASAHTPYGQWVTYRRKHLLIGCHRSDPMTYELAKALVSEFENSLPEAAARVARAPNAQRLASLLGTDQLELAVLERKEAFAMVMGEGRFAPYGAVPLTVLSELSDDRLLFAHQTFPVNHASLVAKTLAASALAREDGVAAPLDWHPAVLHENR